MYSPSVFCVLVQNTEIISCKIYRVLFIAPLKEAVLNMHPEYMNWTEKICPN